MYGYVYGYCYCYEACFLLSLPLLFIAAKFHMVYTWALKELLYHDVVAYVCTILVLELFGTILALKKRQM